MMAYLSVRGNAPGPLFMLQDGRPLSRVLLTDWLRQTGRSPLLAYLETFAATVSA